MLHRIIKYEQNTVKHSSVNDIIKGLTKAKYTISNDYILLHFIIVKEQNLWQISGSHSGFASDMLTLCQLVNTDKSKDPITFIVRTLRSAVYGNAVT